MIIRGQSVTVKGQSLSIGRDLVYNESLVLHIDSANPKSYPGTGNAVYDLSLYGNHGTVSGSAVFDSPLRGFEFDGINDFIDVPNSPSLNITGNLTLSAWVFITGVVNTSFQASGIISKGYGPQFSGDTQYGGYSLHHRYSDYQLWFEIDNINNSSGNQRRELQPGTPANLNALNPAFPVGPPSTRWHNVTCTFDGTTMRMYLNTVLLGTKDPGITIGSTPMNVWIGRLHTGGGQAWYLKGYIPHVMIYNKALTDAEIIQNYNALKGRFGLF